MSDDRDKIFDLRIWIVVFGIAAIPLAGSLFSLYWGLRPLGVDSETAPGRIASAPLLMGPEDVHVLAVGADVLLRGPEQCDQLNIGIGSPVFMIGRLMNHEGRFMNTPAVRFGRISMMPGEPVRNRDTGLDQESFLIEMHSISGFSGSPVFSYEEGGASYASNSWLLGIDWGHLPGPDGSTSADNAGIACIVPSWTLARLLFEDEDVKGQRKEVLAQYPELEA